MSSPINVAIKRICTGLLAMQLVGCGASGNTAAAPSSGTLAFLTSAVTATQASGQVSLSVSRAGGYSGAVSVTYATSNGTATAGTDYTAASGTLSWPDGDTTPRTIAVTLSTVTAFYGTKAFAVSLSSATNGAALGTSAIAVNITGSLSAPLTPGTLGFTSNTATLAQTAGPAILSVARTSGSSGAVGLSYATTDGTAIKGTDYTATTGTLSWASGDMTSKTISVPVSTTTPFSGIHAFTLALSSPTGGASLGAIANQTVNITGMWIPPSNYSKFDLTKWKLTLPIDQYGGTGGTNNIQYEAQTILSSQLTSGFVDAYFYADTAANLIFTTPSNGATTTPGSGSDHTRSELREIFNGTGADSNGDWNSTIGGTLTATCAVQAVSVDADEATIGQIHGQTYVFMLILYRPAQRDIAVDVYTSNTSTSAHARVSLLPNVTLGDTVTYTIQYSGGTIVTSVRDVTTNSATQTMTSSPDGTWAGTPVYFKLGAYHAAPNIGNPAGDQTRVVFSSFSVSHP